VGNTFYPEQSKATTVLVLGILGIVICSLLAPIAWYMGNEEVSAIDAGRRDPSNRGTANAGRILGIIGTVLIGVGTILVIVLVAGGSGR
jgi:hypothetical protein